MEANQLHHYLYRGDTLSNMNFYDFCRCVRVQAKSQSKRNKNTADTRLGVLRRHILKREHPQHETHELVEHTNELRGNGVGEFVPQIVGMSIPQSTHGITWMLFVLCHFKPFSCDSPLLDTNENIEDVYSKFEFSVNSRRVMDNWEAIHECEDQHDAE